MRPAQVIQQVEGEGCVTLTKDEEGLRGAEESSIKAIRESERRGRRKGGREKERDAGYKETGQGINGDETRQSHVKKGMRTSAMEDPRTRAWEKEDSREREKRGLNCDRETERVPRVHRSEENDTRNEEGEIDRKREGERIHDEEVKEGSETERERERV